MNYTIVRSNRKTLCLQITDKCDIVVKAPKFLPKSQIDEFVEKHIGWINKKIEYQKRKSDKYNLTDEQIKLLRKNALEYLPKAVEYYSAVMGVRCEGVKITSAKKRFGSCSGKNNICFSLYLMKYPKDAVDYVVVHELAHIKYKNHSKEFYLYLERFMPDYKKREKLLKQ